MTSFHKKSELKFKLKTKDVSSMKNFDDIYKKILKNVVFENKQHAIAKWR